MKLFSKEKANKKVLIPVAVIVILLVCAISYLGYEVSAGTIAKNTYIAGVDIGNCSRTEALNRLSNSGKFKNIRLTYGKRSWNIGADEIELKINFKETVDSAYGYNHGSNPFVNMFNTLKSDLGAKHEVPMDISFDNELLEREVQEVKSEVDRKVKDATLVATGEKVELVKDQPGLDLNVEKTMENIKTALEKDEFDVKPVIAVKNAKVTSEDLKGMDTLLSSYSTVYYGSPGHDYNIEKSARDSSGIILKPGQEFSFNGLTDEKTIKNGYKNAPVIESGKLSMGIGGGVCQTSSTIFNAALFSGMEITERRNHTIPSNYVKMGRDATVFDGDPGQDFKFKNPFKNPVYIKNYTSGKKVVSEIFGSKEDYKNIKIDTVMLGSYGGGQNETVSDPSLPAGKKVVEKYASPGYKVATYRTYLDKNGNVIKKEQIAFSNYPSQVGKVRVGSGASKNAAVTKNKKAGNTVSGVQKVKPAQTGTANTAAQSATTR